MKKRMCKYFRGLANRNSTCDKGHNYRDMTPGETSGWYLRIPCRDGSENGCPDREFPTHEELVKEKKEFEKELNYSSKAIELIKKQTGANPSWECYDEDVKGSSGSIDCPKCGCELHFVVSNGNHHIHGQCSTEGCLQWMM